MEFRTVTDITTRVSHVRIYKMTAQNFCSSEKNVITVSYHYFMHLIVGAFYLQNYKYV